MGEKGKQNKGGKEQCEEGKKGGKMEEGRMEEGRK